MYLVQYGLIDGSTYVPSFAFPNLEAAVEWARRPERLKSWRLLGVTFVLPFQVTESAIGALS